jgi:hypothetical protein
LTQQVGYKRADKAWRISAAPSASVAGEDGRALGRERGNAFGHIGRP